MEEILGEERKLSVVSWIFAGLSILFSAFLAINSFVSFYRLQILGDVSEHLQFSFFTTTSFIWANLVFGFLFLGGAYLAYLGIKKKDSFNIYASFVYTFALISLFVSYLV